jgi:hypothetical protein
VRAAGLAISPEDRTKTIAGAETEIVALFETPNATAA